MSKCPGNKVNPVDGSFTLYFTLLDRTGNDRFYEMITSVNCYIFNSNKTLIDEKRFETDDLVNKKVSTKLGQKPGWKLDLEPGDYYAVCWGNVGTRTEFKNIIRGITSFQDCAIQIKEGASTGDPLYYAPYIENPWQVKSDGTAITTKDPHYEVYAFTVEKGLIKEKEMRFICAHRTVNVYVIGHTTGTVVSATHLGADYNFLYQTGERHLDFMQPLKEVTLPEGRALMCTFYFLFDEITDDILFALKTSAVGAKVDSSEISFKQYLVDAGISDREYIYNIYYKVDSFGLGVSITFSDWGSVAVTPK
jgi:hypothetical protein